MNYAIILTGGIGSRFWPLSRKFMPKQFLKIMGKETFLVATIRRIRNIISDRNIFIVTNRDYYKKIRKQISVFSIPEKNIFLEPKPLNTLPAISLCAQLIGLKEKEANLLVLPIDHYIKDNIQFKKDILKAQGLASKGYITLIGVKPSGPYLGYGYIKTGKGLGKGIFNVKSFEEKPTLNKARFLIKKKNALWNVGIFCFRADVFLNELNKFLPKMFNQVKKIRCKNDIKKVWDKISAASIDCGIMERSKNLAVIKAGFDWCDLGSWDALSSVLPKDRNNNIILAESVDLNSKNILVYSRRPKYTIATISLKNLVIVDTPDALLICNKEKTQEIKKLVTILNKKGKKCV